MSGWRALSLASLVALAPLALGACGDEPAEPPLAEPPATSPPPSRGSGDPVDDEDRIPTPRPPAPSSFEVPDGDLRGDASKGQQLYALYCASCHGAEGRGDGVMAATLDPKPANHADPAYMGTLSDAGIYEVIHQGGAAVGKSSTMAPWGAVINDQGIRDLVAHIRALSGT